MSNQHKENCNCETEIPGRSQHGSEEVCTCLRVKKTRRRFAFGDPNSRRSRRNRQFSTGHWLPQENLRYLAFLQQHHTRFLRRSVRKTGRIFKLMERAIQTRSSIQCRSHHQKMQLKFSSFDEIIRFLTNETASFNRIAEESKEASAQHQRTAPPTPELSHLEVDDGQYLMPVGLEPSYTNIHQQPVILRLCGGGSGSESAQIATGRL